jgi:ribosome modulation factor
MRKKQSPFDAAERKGKEAANAGLTRDACPYRDRRTYKGTVTFSRAFRRAWMKGWKSAQNSFE